MVAGDTVTLKSVSILTSFSTAEISKGDITSDRPK